jgi:hypothetical protein
MRRALARVRRPPSSASAAIRPPCCPLAVHFAVHRGLVGRNGLAVRETLRGLIFRCFVFSVARQQPPVTHRNVASAALAGYACTAQLPQIPCWRARLVGHLRRTRQMKCFIVPCSPPAPAYSSREKTAEPRFVGPESLGGCREGSHPDPRWQAHKARRRVRLLRCVHIAWGNSPASTEVPGCWRTSMDTSNAPEHKTPAISCFRFHRRKTCGFESRPVR